MEQYKKNVKRLEEEGKPIVLQFSPGDKKYIESTIAIDWIKKPSVDIVADISKGLDFIENKKSECLRGYQDRHSHNYDTWL